MFRGDRGPCAAKMVMPFLRVYPYSRRMDVSLFAEDVTGAGLGLVVEARFRSTRSMRVFLEEEFCFRCQAIST